MPSPFPFNLVSRLKISTSIENGVRAGYFHSYAVIAAAVIFLAMALPGAFAADETVAEAGEATATGASQGSQAVAGTVSTNEEVVGKSQEALLKQALQDIKDNRLNEAINNLGRLKEAYPDNDDYLLLYRTALRKKNSSDSDSQKWYSYVRSLDKSEKEEEEKHSFLEASGEGAATRGEGRLNQLKRETWLVLTTGKYKSANQGRRITRPAKSDEGQ